MLRSLRHYHVALTVLKISLSFIDLTATIFNMDSKSAIIISKLHKVFKTSKGETEALKGLDLEVPHGKVFGFLGPNGAGKTTTLRILTTLLPFDSGEAFVAGIDVKKNHKRVREQIGYVSQKGSSDRHATGLENLVLQGRLYGLNKKEAILKALALSKEFSLDHCIKRLTSTYSGGEKRRLDIALGIMHQPKILFMDEPSIGLDPQSRSVLWSEILKLKEMNITVFLTSHYLDEIDILSDNVGIIDHGKIVAFGTPFELKQQISGDIISIGVKNHLQKDAASLFKNEKNFIREFDYKEKLFHLYVEKGESALPLVLKLLEESKIQAETIQMSTPSLNDVFLKKTGRFLVREENVKRN